jgi:hypothetical protein
MLNGAMPQHWKTHSGSALGVKLARSPLIGWGDVKFMTGLAGLLGWWSHTAVFTALVGWIALILATSAVVAIIPALGRPDVPYGPALLLGALGTFFTTG